MCRIDQGGQMGGDRGETGKGRSAGGREGKGRGCKHGWGGKEKSKRGRGNEDMRQ